MAKNITLLGASYTGVPGVLLPQTGGGTALFTDVGDTTAVAADVSEGKIFYAADGSKQVGTSTGGGGGNDFIITLTKNASTGVWEPDCTYAEMYAAYTGGKTIAVVTDTGAPCSMHINTEPSFNCAYTVDDDLVDTSTGTYGINNQMFSWTSTGVSLLDEFPMYDAYDADAVPADVASGKVFYSASGRQVGTASGGGGLDASFKAVIQRDSADITLPDDLTKVGNYAFYDGENLRITSLPNSLTTIGDYAFGLSAINMASLPSGVTSIGQYAFYNCSDLALTSLPSGITTIKTFCFHGCSNLALTSLPSGVTSIGQYAFYNCSNLALTSLPSGITAIPQYCFYGCTSMTSMSCDGAITTLGGNSFTGSSSHQMQLAHVSFPNMAVSSLGYAFGSTTSTNACRLLEDADIGSTKAIAANAFANCYKLQTLILRKTGSICTLSNVSAFLNTPMRGYNSLSGTIYVPSALISTYQTATNWSTIYGEGHVTFAAIEGSEYEL